MAAPHSKLAAAALAYAKAGWRVLPLQPRSKRPLAKLVPHGVKNATSDIKTIRAWWRAEPNANIGLALGDGYIVVDVDGDEGERSLAALEHAHGALPPTLTVITSRGRHHYFALPDGARVPCARLAAGIDLKSSGGYVVAPPSLHPSGKRYRPVNGCRIIAAAPQWLIAPHRRDGTDGKADEGAHADRDPIGLDDLRVSERIKALIRDGVAEGKRSEAIFAVICAMLRAGHADAEIIAVLSNPEHGLSQKVLSKGKRREHVEKWLRGEIERARAEIDQERAESFAATVARLKKLPRDEYDRVRRAEASRGGWRQRTLDDAVDRARGDAREGDAARGGQGSPLKWPEPEPWPDEVAGASLLDKLAATVRRYVVMAPGQAEAAALWVAGAHVLDAFAIFPRLVITSPEKQCGKTTLIDIISRLVPKPLSVSNATVSPLFRAIAMVRPTLLLDEADSFVSDNEAMRGIINAGDRREGKVLRSVGDDFEPREFSVFAAMAIAAIGRVPATIEDRAIIVSLKRKRSDERVASFRTVREEVTAPLDRLARQAARWAGDHIEALGRADPAMPAAIYNRAADNWHPLLAIADHAGGRWPALARRIAETMAAEAMGGDASILVMLLADIRAVFATKRADRAHNSAGLASALAGIEGRPWAEWRNGKPLSANALARRLAPLGITPSDIKIKGRSVKGYRVEQFEDAFARYLPPLSTA